MVTKRVGQVDLTTGEMMEGAALAVIFPKRQNGFKEGWFAMSQGALHEIVNAPLTRNGLRVLIYLLSKLDFGNLISVSQSDIARALGIERANVNRAMKQLVELEVLIEGPKVGLHKTYRLNASYGWKGRALEHQKAMRDELSERMKKARMTIAS
jgi:predicted transcriptional regulator